MERDTQKSMLDQRGPEIAKMEKIRSHHLDFIERKRRENFNFPYKNERGGMPRVKAQDPPKRKIRAFNFLGLLGKTLRRSKTKPIMLF